MKLRRISFDPLLILSLFFLTLIPVISCYILLTTDSCNITVKILLIVFFSILVFFLLVIAFFHIKIISFEKEYIVIYGIFKKEYVSWTSVNICYNTIAMIIFMRAFTLEIEIYCQKKFYCICKEDFYEKIKELINRI